MKSWLRPCSVPFVVEPDASDVALSASLHQRGRPAAFFSRTLTKVERNQSSVEKEAAAIVEAIRMWNHFLLGRKFTLITSSFVWARSSFIHCLAARDFGAGVEQPFGCLIVQNRQAVQSVWRSMDWTLEDDMVDGLLFCTTLTGRRGGHTPFVQAGAETSDTGAEAVKPDPGSSWESHSGGVYRCLELKFGVLWGCSPTPRSIDDPPTAPHVCCCMYVMLLLSEKLMSCCTVGTNGCLDLRRRATALDGRVSAEWSRYPGSTAQRPRDSVAPLRRSSACWMPARIGRLSAGVGRMHPVTIRKASLMVGSMRRVWTLQQQTGAQYFAVEWTRATVAARNVVARASQPEPASRLRSATSDVSFLRSDSRCRRYVSDLSNVTPMYLASEQKGRVSLLKLIDFQLTLSFLVVEMEDCRHRFRGAELSLINSQ